MTAPEAGGGTVVPETEASRVVIVNRVTRDTRVVFEEQAVDEAIERLGVKLAEEYVSRGIGSLAVVSVLEGATAFTDRILAVMRRAAPGLTIDRDEIKVKSYDGDESGEFRILKDISIDLTGREVLVLDDILDTGQTIRELMNLFKERGAAVVKAAVLVEKQTKRRPDGLFSDEEAIGYALQSEDKFLVGGQCLDYQEEGGESQGRTWPEIREVMFDDSDADPHPNTDTTSVLTL